MQVWHLKNQPVPKLTHRQNFFTNSKVVKVISDGEHNGQTKKPCNPKTGNKVSASVRVSKAANVSEVANQKMQKTCVPGKITNSRYTDVGSSGVPTYNRYEVLNLDDGIVLRHSDGALTSPQSDCVSSDSAKRHDSTITSKNHTASYYDAMTKTNPTVFSRPDPPSEAIGSSAMDTDMQVTTKYDLPLRLKDRQLDYTKVMGSCPTLQTWNKQTGHKFGFIPMGELDVPFTTTPSKLNIDPLALHKVIKASGEYNFKNCQINVKSQLNPDVWDEFLEGYWDSQLPLFIRFGFLLDFDRNSKLESHSKNHASAKNYPQDVQAYLKEEMEYNAILGPFDQTPLNNMHTSPFMTREKSNSTNRRVIIDLSFPQGKSVNTGSAKDIYLGTPFVLKLPTIDHITKQIRSLGKGCMIYKNDIKRAFRHVKLDPRDYDLLGLCQYKWFLDTCLPFGFRHGSALFQRLSDAVRHMMRQRGHDVINYIDDILGIELPSRVDASFDALSSLLERLGFEISHNKLVTPATCVNCLGVLVNTKDFTLAVPNQKMQEILQKCQTWRQKNSCTKRQLQSLLGSLLFISKCVRSSRFFLNRLLDVLRSMHDKDEVALTPEAQRDINWFQKFLPSFNGVAIFDHRPIAHEIELDACLQGVGAR